MSVLNPVFAFIVKTSDARVIINKLQIQYSDVVDIKQSYYLEDTKDSSQIMRLS